MQSENGSSRVNKYIHKYENNPLDKLKTAWFSDK